MPTLFFRHVLRYIRPRHLPPMEARLPLVVKLRSGEEAREELRLKGVSVSEWAVANGFSTALVFEVLAGDRKCIRGQSHNIAVALGLKEGEICANPAKALERRASA